MACILTYHHIAPPPRRGEHRGLFVAPEDFAWQMALLRSWEYRVVSLDEVADDLAGARGPARRAVAITFDDGGADNYANALPILRERRIPATIFLVAGKLGRGREKPGWPDAAARYLDPDEIREMAAAGVEFGSHTLTHARLARLDAAQCERELVESKRLIEDVTGRPANWLSYPFGSHSPRVIEAARRAGFRGAVSTVRDNRVRPDELFAMPRVMVMPGISPRRFAYYLSPLYHWLHVFKNRKRWARKGS